MSTEKHIKHCSDCKWFEYASNAAHKNRCGKFKENGKAGAIAAIRVHGGKCQDGMAWEGHGKREDK